MTIGKTIDSKKLLGFTNFYFILATLPYLLVFMFLVSGNTASGQKPVEASVYLVGRLMVCLLPISLGIYQYLNNRRLMKKGLAVERNLGFSYRTWNYVVVGIMFFIALCLCLDPIYEIAVGSANGGAFFPSYKLKLEPAMFWELIAFHFFLASVPFFGGILSLIFSPLKAIMPIETGNKFASNLVKNADDEAKNIAK